MKRTVCLLLGLFFLTLYGCTNSQNTVVRYDIKGVPQSLDAQFAQDPAERLVITSLYEGLFVRGEDGTAIPGAAEWYQESDDGLTWSFRIRSDCFWSDGTPVAPDDFLFAFERIFHTDTPSPHAADYFSIRNASQVLQGELPFSELGVKVTGSNAIEFYLEYKDPRFPEKLASSVASPCNREFFTQTRGRYGLELRYILTNGPFVMERWDSTRIVLRQSEYNAQESGISGVSLYFDREDPYRQFAEGKSDLVYLPRLQSQNQLQIRYEDSMEFEAVTWCIVFNQNSTVFGSPLLRQSLAHTVDRETLSGLLDEHQNTARALIPPAVQISGQSYREQAGQVESPNFDPGRGARLYEMAMQSLELETLPPITFLIPESMDAEQHAGMFQQDWQRYLGVYVNVYRLPEDELMERYETGDYQMLLLPLSPSDDDPFSLPSQFLSLSEYNNCGYYSDQYDNFLESALEQETAVDLVQRLSMAETQLLSDCVVIPLYYEKGYYLAARKLTDLTLSPFGGLVRFN